MYTQSVTRLQSLRQGIEPLRHSLLHHSVYELMATPDALRIFMQHHVWAVWDFMSLLKSLQRELTVVQVPWIPAADAGAARLINDIVLGEETDSDGEDGFISHFELYLQCMTEAGASTREIQRLVTLLRAGRPLDHAIEASNAPLAAARFVRHTFRVIEHGDLPALASAFTFGREDLLPDVFQKIVDDLSGQFDSRLDRFRYYLARHIELDGDSHGPMSEEVLIRLCGEDDARWNSAQHAAEAALRERLLLWDGIAAAIRSSGK